MRQFVDQEHRKHKQCRVLIKQENLTGIQAEWMKAAISFCSLCGREYANASMLLPGEKKASDELDVTLVGVGFGGVGQNY